MSDAPPLILVLPWPPSVNDYWGIRVVGKRAITFVAEDGKAFKKNVRLYLRMIRAPHFGLDRLALDILVNPPNLVARDLDNLNKAIWDSLSDEYETVKLPTPKGPKQTRVLTVKGIWCNDAQVDKFRMMRGPVIKGGRITVAVTVLSHVEQQVALALPVSMPALAEAPF